MADEPPEHDETSTYESNAGAPANLGAQRPDEAELDRRDREKSRPRRAAGPPLNEGDSGDSRSADDHSPPAPTDPSWPQDASGGHASEDEAQAQGVTHTSDAGLPADHVGPKPSADELDRRDRQKAAPRRAAGPPLPADRNAERAAALHEPPPPTDPRE